jgi:hypothetical protein
VIGCGEAATASRIRRAFRVVELVDGLLIAKISLILESEFSDSQKYFDK